MKTSRLLTLAIGVLASALTLVPQQAKAQGTMSDFDQLVEIHNKAGDTFYIARKGGLLTAFRGNGLTTTVSPVGTSTSEEFAAVSHQLASEFYASKSTVSNRAYNALAVVGIASLALTWSAVHDNNMLEVIATYGAAWAGGTRLCSFYKGSQRSCYTNVADVAKDLAAGQGGDRLDIWVTSDETINFIMSKAFKRPAGKATLRLVSGQ